MSSDHVKETEHEAVTDLRQHLKKIALINHASTILSWDQETHMPSSGGGVRAEALGELAGIAHERAQHPSGGARIGRAEEAAEASGNIFRKAQAALAEAAEAAGAEAAEAAGTGAESAPEAAMAKAARKDLIVADLAQAVEAHKCEIPCARSE